MVVGEENGDFFLPPSERSLACILNLSNLQFDMIKVIQWSEQGEKTNYMRVEKLNIFTYMSKVKPVYDSLVTEKETYIALTRKYVAKQTEQDQVTPPYQSSFESITCCLSSSILLASSSTWPKIGLHGLKGSK
jgi:hypothetical protein